MCLLKLFGFGTSSWDFQKLLLINRHRKKNLNKKDRVNWRESIIPMESKNESESPCRVKFEGIKNPNPGINPCAGREKFKAITSDEFRSKIPGQCQSLALEGKLKLKTKTGFVWNLDDTSALKELQERVGHKNRVMDGLSVPHMLESSPVEKFSHLYPEFLNVYTRSQLRLLEKDFSLADLDQDGFLNKIEIKYWMEKRLQPITERELRAILCHCDEDKDGSLNFREFILMCQHVEYISNSEPFNSNASSCQKENLSFSDQYQIKKPQVEIEAHVLQNNNHNDPNQESFNFEENNSCLNPSNSKSSSKFKGKVRDTVKYFETQINEVTKDADLDRVQNDELRNNKIKNKLNAHYPDPTNDREASCEREIHKLKSKDECNKNESECPCQSHCECSLPVVENESQCQSENKIPFERSASSKSRSRSRSRSRKFSHLKKLHEEGCERESLNDINWTNSKCYTSKEKQDNNLNLQCGGVAAKKTNQEENQNVNGNSQCEDDSVVSLPPHLHQAKPGIELLETDDELGICKGGSSLISNPPDLNQKCIDDCTCDVQIIIHADQENVDVEVELDNDNEENATTCTSEVAVDALMSSSLVSTPPVENKKEVQNHKGEGHGAHLLSQNQISPKSYKKPSWLGNLFLWH